MEYIGLVLFKYECLFGVLHGGDDVIEAFIVVEWCLYSGLCGKGLVCGVWWGVEMEVVWWDGFGGWFAVDW